MNDEYKNTAHILMDIIFDMIDSAGDMVQDMYRTDAHRAYLDACELLEREPHHRLKEYDF